MIVENTEDVSRDVIEAVVQAAPLPDGELYLLIGDPQLPDCQQGLTVPRELVDVLALTSSVGSLDQRLDVEWDCGVLISTKWAIRQPTYTSYFAYLLGHELGHAVIALTDLQLMAFQGLIVQDLPEVCQGCKWQWHELPHEIRCDQFGIAIAADLYGREALNTEIEELITNDLGGDKLRLRKMLQLEPRPNLEGLWDELAAFSFPYMNELMEKWQADIDAGLIGLIQYIDAPSALWDR